MRFPRDVEFRSRQSDAIMRVEIETSTEGLALAVEAAEIIAMIGPNERELAMSILRRMAVCFDAMGEWDIPTSPELQREALEEDIDGMLYRAAILRNMMLGK